MGSWYCKNYLSINKAMMWWLEINKINDLYFLLMEQKI